MQRSTFGVNLRYLFIKIRDLFKGDGTFNGVVVFNVYKPRQAASVCSLTVRILNVGMVCPGQMQTEGRGKRGVIKAA